MTRLHAGRLPPQGKSGRGRRTHSLSLFYTAFLTRDHLIQMQRTLLNFASKSVAQSAMRAALCSSLTSTPAPDRRCLSPRRYPIAASTLVPPSENGRPSAPRRSLHAGAGLPGPVSTSFRADRRSAPAAEVEETTRLRIAVDVDEGGQRRSPF